MSLQLLIGNKNYSSWSLRPWLAMEAAGIDFEETVLPLYEPGSKETILEWSPGGKVPVVKDGAVTIWDSLAILEYLAERHPDKHLWPDDPAARALARSISAEMHSGFMALRREMPMNIRRSFPDRMLSDDAQADIARVIEIWNDCRQADWAADGPFLFGRFTNADAMFAPVATRFLTYGVDIRGDAARRYAQDLLAMPAMEKWIAAAHTESWVIDRFEQI